MTTDAMAPTQALAHYPDLRGRTVLITGAGGGLGTAMAAAFAAQGARLALFDATVEAAAQSLKTSGGDGVALAADALDEQSIVAAVDEVTRSFGSIDVLINNAGTGGWDSPKLTHLTPVEEWRHVYDVNVTGVFLMCRAVLPGMVDSGRGSIINISSATGITTLIGRSPYSSSKAAVLHFTRNLATEYAEFGIRANALCPGWTRTPMMSWRLEQEEFRTKVNGSVPLGRVGEPPEQAQACLFLASDASSYLNGHGMVVDGGWTVTWAQRAPSSQGVS